MCLWVILVIGDMSAFLRYLCDFVNLIIFRLFVRGIHKCLMVAYRDCLMVASINVKCARVIYRGLSCLGLVQLVKVLDFGYYSTFICIS